MTLTLGQLGSQANDAQRLQRRNFGADVDLSAAWLRRNRSTVSAAAGVPVFAWYGFHRQPKPYFPQG